MIFDCLHAPQVNRLKNKLNVSETTSERVKLNMRQDAVDSAIGKQTLDRKVCNMTVGFV